MTAELWNLEIDMNLFGREKSFVFSAELGRLAQEILDLRAEVSRLRSEVDDPVYQYRVVSYKFPFTTEKYSVANALDAILAHLGMELKKAPATPEKFVLAKITEKKTPSK